MNFVMPKNLLICICWTGGNSFSHKMGGNDLKKKNKVNIIHLHIKVPKLKLGGKHEMGEKILKLDSFFKQSDVFLDDTVFTNEWIPDCFLFRELEVKQIGQCFADLIRGRPGHLYCNGLPSTGKTHIVKKAALEFDEFCKANRINAKCIYVTSSGKTVNVVCEKILNQFDPDAKTINYNISLAFDKIASESKKYEYVVFIFDEIDKMRPTSRQQFGTEDNPINTLLSKIVRFKEEYNFLKSKIMIIVVSNDTKLFRHLTQSATSYFNPINMHFPAYDAVQLYQIFKERCKRGFLDGIIDDEQLQLFASRIFSGSKDVRTGLEILLQSGKAAESNGTKKITKENIKKAIELVEKNKLIETILKLDDAEIAFLLSIAKSQMNKPDELVVSNVLFKNYEKIVNKYGLAKEQTRHLQHTVASKLDSIGLITTALTSRGYKKGVMKQFQIMGESLDEIIKICENELQRRWG